MNQATFNWINLVLYEIEKQLFLSSTSTLKLCASIEAGSSRGMLGNITSIYSTNISACSLHSILNLDINVRSLCITFSLDISARLLCSTLGLKQLEHCHCKHASSNIDKN